MRKLIAAILLAATATATAAAAPLAAQTKPSPTVIRAKDVPLYDVYAWERWGNFINAQAGGKTEIPYDAARLQVKVYTYPGGEIRAIRFNNAVRTHRHINMTDTLLYSWQAHRVQYVNNLAVVAGPGDFAFHQKGVDHSGEEIRRGGGIDLEFVYFNPGRHNDPTGFWTFAKDNPVVDASDEDGARYRTRRADFPGGLSAREVYLPAGTSLRSRDGEKERLFFVLSGKVRVSTADKPDEEIGVEDSAYAAPGKDFRITASEDAKFVEAFLPPLK